ncbi:MAG: hypothetical protein CSA07_03815 [Bacteroidia bacterium]|nr:MAG: hypothetical protein CSA07_03815 [Bacteroidia bacterium]
MKIIILMFIVYSVIKYLHMQQKAKAAKRNSRAEEGGMQRGAMVGEPQTDEAAQPEDGMSMSDILRTVSGQWGAEKKELLEELERLQAEATDYRAEHDPFVYQSEDERIEDYGWREEHSIPVSTEPASPAPEEAGPLDSTSSIEFATGDQLQELRTEAKAGETKAYAIGAHTAPATRFDARQAIIYAAILQRWRPYQGYLAKRGGL